MRALVQRVSRARVTVDGTERGAIGIGLLIFVGVKNGDTEADAEYLAAKCCSLRAFEDKEQKMNLSVQEVGGSVLAVSQFTLYGDTRRGNRPSFVEAAPPAESEPLYEAFLRFLRARLGAEHVSSGVFRAMMDVELTNDGPVTLMIESKG
ncbi:MAG TPA: D-aminoacyl-tRNA deacylase [Bacteroidota bacterium]|nr:D-aminoacyl-tRNA deacylase [Bacteroidota bacterium]